MLTHKNNLIAQREKINVQVALENSNITGLRTYVESLSNNLAFTSMASDPTLRRLMTKVAQNKQWQTYFEQFGVVVLDDTGAIVEYAEKPEKPVSDLAMIGIYHFRDGAALRREIDVLIDNDMRKGNEFQLPDAFRALTEQGARFMPGEVTSWYSASCFYQSP